MALRNVSNVMATLALLAVNKANQTLSPTGAVQGMITGIRGLCNGLGPALYGIIFFLFNVELNELDPNDSSIPKDPKTEVQHFTITNSYRPDYLVLPLADSSFFFHRKWCNKYF